MIALGGEPGERDGFSESVRAQRRVCVARGRRVPPWPTDALPGTLAKILVMQWRLYNGYHLYHPLDATMAGIAGTDRARDD